MLRNVGLRKSVEQPVLDLNFAAAQIGSNAAPDSRIDFSRGSNAYFVDSDGLVKKSPHNLITQSEAMTASNSFTITNLTVTENVVIAPDGTLTADNYDNQSGGVTALVTKAVAVPASSTNDYYAFFFAKKSGANNTITFNVYYHGNAEDNVAFNLDTETVTSAPSDAFMEDVGNGWYRCGYKISRDGTGSKTQINWRFWPQGRGNTSGSMYVWGGQLSQHTTLPVDNPYLKTTSSAVYAARLDHDPTWFMSAAQEHNLLEYSEMLDDSYWTKSAVTVTANAETDPLGGTTAEYVFATSPSGTFPAVVVDFDVAKGVVHTLSFYAKKGERDRIHVDNQNPGPVFNENVINNAELTSEWQRFTGTFTPDENTSRLAFYFGFGAKTWSGDQGFYLWGLQVEVGSTAGTYHRTTGAPYYGEGATPRGLLVEEQRANLVTDSESSTYLTGSGATLTADAALAPDGTTTAISLLETSANSGHIANKSVTVSDNSAVCFSCFVKANGRDTGALEFFGAGFEFVSFDLGAESVTVFTPSDGGTNGFGDIESYGNGWYRIHAGLTTKSGDTSGFIQVRITDDGTTSYAGDTTKGLLIWGLQLEQGSFPTSYIKTTGASATRNADVATMGPTTGGTELVVNGTFDTNSDWNDNGSGTIAISGGKLTFASTAQFKNAHQSLASKVVVGRRYRASFDVTSYTSGNVKIQYREGSGNTLIAETPGQNSTGTYTFDFTCSDAAVNKVQILTTGSGTTNTFEIDNVSVRELYPFEAYNPSEGTALFEASVPHGMKTFSSFFNIADDGNYGERVSIINNDTNAQVYTQVRDAGATVFNTFGNPVSYTYGTRFRVAIAYAASDFASTIDVSNVRKATSGTVPSMDSIKIGVDAANTTNGSFHARRVRIFPKRLPDSILQSLTSD